MRRALASFQLLGVDAVPAATDFRSERSDSRPQLAAGCRGPGGSSRALRGYVVYRRGWV
ncbi:MAG: hypothetical protein KIS75_13690 [Chromatiales bacterium]|nr:hypothetical protein [Chromatiales bacterium]